MLRSDRWTVEPKQAPSRDARLAGSASCTPSPSGEWGEADKVLFFVFATHPRAAPLLEQAVGIPAISMREQPQAFVRRLCEAFHVFAPDLRPEDILAPAERGLFSEQALMRSGPAKADAGNIWLGATAVMMEPPCLVVRAEEEAIHATANIGSL